MVGEELAGWMGWPASVFSLPALPHKMGQDAPLRNLFHRGGPSTGWCHRMKCAVCDDKACRQGRDCVGLHDASIASYTDRDLRVHAAASWVEATYYGEKSRLEEVALFARRLGASRLGLAFCSGLPEEARVVHAYLEKEGFEVHSVICKACGVDKGELGATRMRPEGQFDPSCNPAGQAGVLADAGTELNVVLGLCVGHDAIFYAHSAAPATTLAVKDRLLAHNPLGMIYTKYGRARLGLK